MSLTAYEIQQRNKTSRFVCPYCYGELDEAHNACCGEAGHGEWMTTCDRCEEVIPDSEEAVDKGRYYICIPCSEKG